MPTINVTPNCTEHLQEIADVLAKSKKVVVVTGAGISTNCGIPDFRSENGLYSLIQAQYDAAANASVVSSAVDVDFVNDRPTKRRKIARSVSTAALQPRKSSRPYTRKASLSFVPSQSATDLTSKGTSKSVLEQSSLDSISSPSVAFSASQPLPATLTASASSPNLRQSLPNLKGRDLFDSMIWADETTTSIFYTFISTLRRKILEDVTNTTKTHKFLKTLRDGGRLVRVYTQNIDGLEGREGMEMDMQKGPGSRYRFGPKTIRSAEFLSQEVSAGGRGGGCGEGGARGINVDTGVEVVQLHGGLDSLRCGLCHKLCEWDEERYVSTSAGSAPECPYCSATSTARTSKGRRSVAIGRLRPDIVLYGEEHPCAHQIGPLITHDISLGPEVLLILGTSLRVHGLKVMVKEFAKAVHAKGGLVVFVNNTKPPDSIWGEVIDFWIESDCDRWVDDLKVRSEDVWLPQMRTAAEDKDGETRPKPIPKNPQAVRKDLTSGAHLTAEIHRMLKEIVTPAKSDTIHPTKPQMNSVEPCMTPVQQRLLEPISTPSQPQHGLLSRPPIRVAIKMPTPFPDSSPYTRIYGNDRQLPPLSQFDSRRSFQSYMTPISGNGNRHILPRPRDSSKPLEYLARVRLRDDEEQLMTPPGSDEPTLPPLFSRSDSPMTTQAEIKSRMSIGNILSSSSPLSSLYSDQLLLSDI